METTVNAAISCPAVCISDATNKAVIHSKGMNIL